MKEVRDQLWDLVYGLLEEAEAADLRQRICSDRAVAREYARVKLQSELVAQAARASAEEKDLASLPKDSFATPAHRGRRLSVARFVAVAASLALSIGMLAYAGSVYWSDDSPLRGSGLAQALEDFEQVRPRMVVVGPAALEPGAANAYEVQLGQLDGTTPLSLPVQIEVQDTQGELLWSERATTSGEGKHTFQVPVNENADPYFKVRVIAGDSLKEDQVSSTAKLETYVPVAEGRRSGLTATNSVTSPDGKNFKLTRELAAENLQGKVIDELLAKEVNESSDGPVRDSDTRLASRNKRDIREAQLNRAGIERSKVRLSVQTGQEAPIESRYYWQASPPVWLKSESGGDRPRDEKKNDKRAERRQPIHKPSSAPSAGTAGGATVLDRPEAKPTTPGDFAEAPAASDLDFEAQLPKPTKKTVAIADPSPISPAENAPVDGELTIDGQKQLGAAKRIDGVANGSRLNELAFGLQLVEQVKINNEVVEQRLVNGVASKEALDARVEELRQAGRIDLAVPGRVDVVLYDASQAPPQKVAESSIEIVPPKEPLQVDVAFDRDWYRSGDAVVAEVFVSDSRGLPVPAVLNVQVDAVSPEEADQDWTPTPPEVSYVSAEGSRSVPLVFDNASEQQAELRRSVEDWLKTRQTAQSQVAAVLLSGTGMGYGLMLLAVALRWRPKPRLWVPMISLLAVSLGLGIIAWQRPVGETADLPATVAPLVTHGVQSEPPVSERKAEPNVQEVNEREEDLLKLAELERLSDRTMLEDLWQPGASDESSKLSGKGEKRNEQRLFAMDEWAAVASSSAANQQDRQDFLTYREPRGGFREDDLNRFGGISHFDLPALRPATSPDPDRDVTGKARPAGAPTGEASTPATFASGGGTVYWHPVVSTDTKGAARVQFIVPEGPLAYRLVVYAQNGRQLGVAAQLLPTVVTTSR